MSPDSPRRAAEAAGYRYRASLRRLPEAAQAACGGGSRGLQAPGGRMRRRHTDNDVALTVGAGATVQFDEIAVYRLAP